MPNTKASHRARMAKARAGKAVLATARNTSAQADRLGQQIASTLALTGEASALRTANAVTAKAVRRQNLLLADAAVVAAEVKLTLADDAARASEAEIAAAVSYSLQDGAEALYNAKAVKAHLSAPHQYVALLAAVSSYEDAYSAYSASASVAAMMLKCLLDLARAAGAYYQALEETPAVARVPAGVDYGIDIPAAMKSIAMQKTREAAVAALKGAETFDRMLTLQAKGEGLIEDQTAARKVLKRCKSDARKLSL